ncbi:stage V sporulation protein AA [Robertmurraya andreesenii]|uniref:Stage V sporulation protein AA n=1 Tax=Anoxybacillus andreesenii TaxID=1325932 RepID=A0ABT9V8T5_9BACL|nr:stage V sporulation protein AA [Robertmurraya andreesenii]MDQ0157230.1 stage V sporulation protein AA [Robertmurraya andreesenii]
MEETIYIRMRHRVQIRPNDTVLLKDIAQIIAHERIHQDLQNLKVYTFKAQDNNIIIIDVMEVIEKITRAFNSVEVQAIGPSQSIIEVIYQKKRMSVPFFVLTWLLLFFGSALAIIYFHEDVSMQATQQKIYTIITGRVEARPLIFQIPYSIGLGLGMILFFNHVFRKRLNDEPSPLEVEMFNYQQDLDRYVSLTENKESMKRIDGH